MNMLDDFYFPKKWQKNPLWLPGRTSSFKYIDSIEIWKAYSMTYNL